MIVHVAFEVSDLARSARFYDALFYALGARRTFESERAVAYGHVALAAAGRAAVSAAYEAGLAHGGSDDGKPGMRPQYGPLYFAAYLLDPDGLRLELVTGAH